MSISNETTSNKIIAVEGQTCQLICRVESGLPKETLYWSHAGKVLVEGGPGNLSHLRALRTENLQTYFLCGMFLCIVSVYDSLSLLKNGTFSIVLVEKKRMQY